MAAVDERQAVDNVVLPLRVGDVLAEVVAGVKTGRDEEAAECLFDIHKRREKHSGIERRSAAEIIQPAVALARGTAEVGAGIVGQRRRNKRGWGKVGGIRAGNGVVGTV